MVGGVLELAYYRAAGDGQAFPTTERHRVLEYVHMSADLGQLVGLIQNNCSLNNLL